MGKDLNKEDIKKIVRDEIGVFVKDSFDWELKKTLSDSNSLSRKEMLDAIKKAMESAFKILWIKRDFWKTDIK